MSWVLEISPGGRNFSALMIGGGVWLSFVWAAVRAPGGERLNGAAFLGMVIALAFGGGFLWGALRGGGGVSSMGAILGAGTALMFLPFPGGWSRWEMVDRLVPAGLAGVSLARLGCLFQGCDVGRLTGGEWGVVHHSGSRAWETHLFQYSMDASSAFSLPVHPFGAYLGLFGLGAALFGEYLRVKGRGEAGQAGLGAAALFFGGGGMIEWFREPELATSLAGGPLYPHIYLLLAVLSLALFQRRRSEGGNERGREKG